MGSTPRTGALPAQMDELRSKLEALLGKVKSNTWTGPASWVTEAVQDILHSVPVQHDDQQGGAALAPGSAPDPADDVFAVECSYCEAVVDAASEPISCEACAICAGSRYSNLLSAIDPNLAAEFDAGDVNLDDLTTRACGAVAALRSAPAKTEG